MESDSDYRVKVDVVTDRQALKELLFAQCAGDCKKQVSRRGYGGGSFGNVRSVLPFELLPDHFLNGLRVVPPVARIT